MGVHKLVIKEGNGIDKPKKGDSVFIEYSGFLYDDKAAEKKGSPFDSSVGRGDFQTAIGVGRVIRGWDEGVVTMSLGEKATLIISSDFAYGEGGFPGLIPPNSALVFDVELKGINPKSSAAP